MRKRCSDCLHYSICEYYGSTYDKEFDMCDEYKDKHLYLELPCKIGDIVYRVNNMTVPDLMTGAEHIEYYVEGVPFCEHFIGKIGIEIFLTYEKAEEQLRRTIGLNNI